MFVRSHRVGVLDTIVHPKIHSYADHIHGLKLEKGIVSRSIFETCLSFKPRTSHCNGRRSRLLDRRGARNKAYLLIAVSNP